jgi:protein TonB
MVKGGKAPAKKKAAAGDADAPSAIGLAPSDAAPMPTIATTSDAAAFKPTLQTLSISQGVSTGLLIKKVPPTYPPSALRMRIEGKVELLATVSKDGDITHIKVLSGDQQLTKAASDAVSKWKYKPYLLNGEPVEIQTQVTVNFKLPQ